MLSLHTTVNNFLFNVHPDLFHAWLQPLFGVTHSFHVYTYTTGPPCSPGSDVAISMYPVWSFESEYLIAPGSGSDLNKYDILYSNTHAIRIMSPKVLNSSDRLNCSRKKPHTPCPTCHARNAQNCSSLKHSHKASARSENGTPKVYGYAFQVVLRPGT